MTRFAGADLDVRRLAAVDMHGARGTRRRRVIILIEFALGAVGGAALGVLSLGGGVAGLLLGLCLLGIGANYVPLTWNVIRLWPQGRLETELAGADLRAELSHYTRAQVWVLVPFWVAGLAFAQARRVSAP
jgi:hypothetical protein